MAVKGLTVTTNAKQVAISMKGIPARTQARLVPTFTRLALKLSTDIKAKLSGSPVGVRTGNLRRAVFHRISVRRNQNSGSLVARAGVDLGKAVYARLLDRGGTITPKRSKYLTIPLGPNLTGNKVARMSAREFIANPGGLGFTGSFVNPRKTAIMGRRADGSIEPVFALATSVTIKPRHFMRDTLRANRAHARRELSQALRMALR